MMDDNRSLTRLSRRRLLNVAKALRESPAPEKFTMRWYTVTNECGTPACALGHYAARRDLQNTLRLSESGAVEFAKDGAMMAGIDDHRLLRHFGITASESGQLFSPGGCGCATSPDQAAEYIETFVREHP